jgi:hypothetical protein
VLYEAPFGLPSAMTAFQYIIALVTFFGVGKGGNGHQEKKDSKMSDMRGMRCDPLVTHDRYFEVIAES